MSDFLTHRMSIRLRAFCRKPKVQPKQVKVTTAATRGSTRGRAGRAGRARGTGRPSRKTAEELDAEMTDYFVGGTGPANNGAGATNGAPAAAAGGDDLGMDEISVRCRDERQLPTKE